jgi:hypothetical protein
MNVKTNSIVSSNGNDDVNLIDGAIIPTWSKLTVNGNINLTGVSTVGILSATNAIVSGVVTATSFIGNGSQLTNISTVSISKSIALKYILSDPPLRS